MYQFRRPLFWVLAVLAIVACDSHVQPLENSPALAAVVTNDNFTVDFVGSRFNTCTNATFTVSGEIHVVYHKTETPSGALVVNGSANFVNLSGSGDTGLYTYHITGKSPLGFNGPLILVPGAVLVEVTLIPQGWIATSGGDSQIFEALFVAVFNANGDFVDMKLDSSRCVG